MEASFVTGPAKNLLEFARRSAGSRDELPDVELVVAGYRRGGEPESAFLGAARAAGSDQRVVALYKRIFRSSAVNPW